MDDLDQAALVVAGCTAAFLLTVFAAWWTHRRRPEPAAPKMPKMPRRSGESRLPRLPRRAEAPVEPVEIAPSRLARVSKAAVEAPIAPFEAYDPQPVPPTPLAPDRVVPPSDIDGPEPAPLAEPATAELERAAPARPEPAIDEGILDALAAQVEQRAHAAEASSSGDAGVRLVPQIPPRDAILRTSWIGGRPRLPDTIEWPRIDGREGDFVAQIACSDLPPALWNGLGPRTGWLAFFTNPDSGDAAALHLASDGPPRNAPRPVGPAYFRPVGLDSPALASLAIPALPEWPVDVVAGAAETDTADDPQAMLAADYDVADPAFHPFDWPGMLAMAQILEDRVLSLPTGGAAPEDANDELAEAIADAAEANRDAAQRAAEIVAIIRESAAADTGFLPSDATAVMAALHAIRWTQVTARPDPESGVDEVEALTLPLTRRRPDGDLWVDAWRYLLFDHARHAWCADPARLSAPARAFFEPLWRAMADRGMASSGHVAPHLAPGFDEERDVILLTLPANGLFGLAPRDGGDLLFTIRKIDLVAGDFDKIRVLTSN